MAAATATAKLVMCTVPFKIVRWTLAAGQDGVTITHGESGTPDIVLIQNTLANPTATEMSVTSVSATQIAVDCEAAAGSAYLYAIWFEQGVGGLSDVA